MNDAPRRSSPEQFEVADAGGLAGHRADRQPGGDFGGFGFRYDRAVINRDGLDSPDPADLDPMPEAVDLTGRVEVGGRAEPMAEDLDRRQVGRLGHDLAGQGELVRQAE